MSKTIIPNLAPGDFVSVTWMEKRMNGYNAKDMMALGALLKERGCSVFPSEFIGHKALRISCLSRRQAIQACTHAKSLAEGTNVEVSNIGSDAALKTFEFYLLPKS